jgi:azurin
MGDVAIPKGSIEEIKPVGTLMPDGIAATMTSRERADLLSFLTSLGKPGGADRLATAMPAHGHAPADFPYDRAPLRPEYYSSASHRVNRERIYDFYAKEADFFRKQPSPPMLLPTYPGLDGGTKGHWGNQDEKTWADLRWNKTIFGTVQCGGFNGEGVTVPKGVCLRLGDQGEMSACFDPQTLCYEAVWTDGFVTYSGVRHGFMEGMRLEGKPLPRPEGAKPDKPFAYHGFYRHGKRVLISYSIDGEEWLDAPWVEGGKFVRNAHPAAEHPLRDLTAGGPMQWPEILLTKGKLGKTRPYATDTIEPPVDNPWNALLFFGGHDFLADGTAMACTMQGDVWRVEGLNEGLEHVSWRRFASGLNQALGLVVADDRVFVLGRDQVTELKDLNGDGEADFYRCVNNTYKTSAAGHDFICGLERDEAGDFYTASGPEGLLRIPGDGKPARTIATGFRNPDGLGLTRSGMMTVPNSEGEWVPTSMICEVRPGDHFGYPGPKDDQPPRTPMVYLPRGLDNSSGGQVEVTSGRWGPLEGKLVHFSFGAGTAFLVIRDEVDGTPQGAVVPFPGDFLSGVHRGRFSPRDGQLYVSGMAGWGTYTALDGCFQRVRYTGDPVQLPVSFHAARNGVLVGFSRPVDPAVALRPENAFAQTWNYRYSKSYGSLEYSTRHPGVAGHDPLAIRSAHVLPDGKTLFLEIPDLQPVNTLHLRLEVDGGHPQELYATVNKLGPPFADFEGYKPEPKTIAAHPILSDMALLKIKKVPNPWVAALPDARLVGIAAGKNLTFTVPSFKVKVGETIKLRFENPDVVPHNWVLARPGSLARVGDLVNKIIAEPDAAARSYIPRTDDVLVYVDIVDPGSDARIFFKAPDAPGRYPYLCTFPGHWMVMNGVMIVE